MYYVYKFLNTKNEVIYIGKAKNIFNRLSTHYSMHSHICDDCYIETRKVLYCTVSNEEEAKKIEHCLISRYKPKYNELLINSEYKLDNMQLLDFTEVDGQRLFKLHARKAERINYKLKSELEELNSYVSYYKERYPNSEKVRFVIHRKTKVIHGVEEKDTYEISPIEEHFQIIFKYLESREFKQIKAKYDIWEDDGRFAMRLQDLGEIVYQVRPLKDAVYIGIGTGYIQLKYTSIQEIEFFFGDLSFYGRDFSVRIW